LAGALVLLFVPIPRMAIGARSPGPYAEDSTADVVNAAAAYVVEYQRQLTSVIADEVYTQTIVRQVPPDDTPRSRRMDSEVFFMFAPGTRMWMAIRDVLALDGSAIADRPEIRTALNTRSASEVAASFKTYNSRFNLGRTVRNFNEPTLGLLPLDSMHRQRFSFKRTATERTGNDLLVTIAFSEKETPTLIRDVKHGRVFSKGEWLVHAGTGRIQRAIFEAKTSEVKVRLTTTYGPEERLGMWVPTLFREEYEHGDARSRESELVVCEASYRNYRRFETSVRVK
jgi:hypothetical protein